MTGNFNISLLAERIFNKCCALITTLLFPFFVLFLMVRLIKKPEYRPKLRERFGRYPNFTMAPNKKRFWVHAVSVGEILSAGTLIHQLQERYPDIQIVVSTTTPAGRAVAEQRLPAVQCMIYFPFDFPWIVRRAVSAIAPQAFFCFETELWPNMLGALAQQHTSVFLVNGRLSEQSTKRYNRARFFFRSVLKNINLFLMQTPEDAKRILQIGAPPERVFCTGNIKYDQAVASIAAMKRPDLGIAKEALFIAGSLHAGEAEIICEVYRRLRVEHPALVLLMAPRHLDLLEQIERICRREEWQFIRKTHITGLHHCPVILLDTFGELGPCYALADVVFVGGSLVPAGGHNILEPAVFSKPVFFGPHMNNFRDIAEALKRAGGGIEVSGEDEMIPKISMLLRDPAARQICGQQAREVVLTHQGATERNLDHIARWI